MKTEDINKFDYEKIKKELHDIIDSLDLNDASRLLSIIKDYKSLFFVLDYLKKIK